MESSLKEESQVKSELTETLMRAHDEVASLNTALSEKESSMRHLICTHETLKTTLKEEIAKLEAEKRDLLSSLDEANLIRDKCEGTVGACREEIQCLRSLLAESQKKCKEIEEWARSGKEAKMREELLVQFEEERNKVENQLKWKCEQFVHLEEAYKKQKAELQEVRREKEVEKLELVSKISELESILDEKTRLAEDLHTRLEMCNQLLAREESKRKLLEAELHESRDRYDSLVTDFEAAKLAVESVMPKRDKEIASLRVILEDKSLQIKDVEFEKAQIEQENQELRASLKEYGEIEIGGVEKSKKFRILEKAHKGCGEKIRVRECEIENLKRDLGDYMAQLNEKDKIVEKLQNELERKEKIRVGNVEIENLKRDLNHCLACLSEKDVLVEKLQIELQERDLELEMEMIKREEEAGVAFLVIEENFKQFEKWFTEIREREGVLIEVNNLRKREDALLKEKKKLLIESREKNGLIEQFKECMDREKALLDEHERLICEVREREEVIKKLNECMEREKLLVRENKRLLCEVQDRKEVMKELEECKEREETLLKEKVMLLCEAREREGMLEQLRKCKENKEGLAREHERMFCEVREREGLIEELKGNVSLLREDNLRLESEVRSLGEEKKKFVEIGNEMAKKLLEIKFKLDPLEEKCTSITKTKKNESSGLETNLELLVEELESSLSEKEQLQLELQEMVTAYFLQKHETEFNKALIYDLEVETQSLKMKLNTKEDSFQSQLERVRLENEGIRVRFLNETRRLQKEKETLELQIYDLNCVIGSIYCADGEVKAMCERILLRVRSDGEIVNEKMCKLVVPVAGTRSPLKENNF